MTHSLPTLYKILGYSTAELSQLPIEGLRACCKVVGIAPIRNPLNEQAERCDLTMTLQRMVSLLRRESVRNLPLDLENCHWAFKTSASTAQALPGNIWDAKPGNKVRDNKTFYSMMVKGLRERGFYEPDIHHSGSLHGVYLCCKLKDAPRTALPLNLDNCKQVFVHHISGAKYFWDVYKDNLYMEYEHIMEEWGYYEPLPGEKVVYQGVYYCCDLADKPDYFEVGDYVTLKDDEEPLRWGGGAEKLWLQPGCKAKVNVVVPGDVDKIYILEVEQGGRLRYYSAWGQTLKNAISPFYEGAKVTLKKGCNSEWLDPGDIAIVESVYYTCSCIVKTPSGRHVSISQIHIELLTVS